MSTQTCLRLAWSLAHLLWARHERLRGLGLLLVVAVVVVIAILAYIDAQLVPLDDKGVHMLDELLDPQQVVRGKLLDVVVARSIYIVWHVLVLGGFVQLDGVVERNDLVALPMDHEHGAVNIGHAIDVGELVEGQGPPEIEDDAQGRHNARVEDHARDRILFSKKTGGSRPNRATVQDDVVRTDVQILC